MLDHHIRRDAGECRVAAFAQRILVASDFSETSYAALTCAVSLVERCNASLHILHVLEEIAGPEPLMHLEPGCFSCKPIDRR